MKRRTLLKGAAAAASGVGLPRTLTSASGSGVGTGRSLTGRVQAPTSYEMISIFVSNDLIYDGDTAWRGTARDITNDGTIIGDTVVNGLMTPTIWDPALTPRYPDLGPYAGRHAYGNLISDDGRATGATIPASELRS